MKRVICDQCRKEEPPDHYGLAPKGWFTVDERGNFAASKDFCSKACVVASFTGDATAEERTSVMLSGTLCPTIDATVRA